MVTKNYTPNQLPDQHSGTVQVSKKEETVYVTNVTTGGIKGTKLERYDLFPFDIFDKLVSGAAEHALRQYDNEPLASYWFQRWWMDRRGSAETSSLEAAFGLVCELFCSPSDCEQDFYTQGDPDFIANSLVPSVIYRELAARYGLGAQKYAERNWEKGYDWSLSFSALCRHYWARIGGEIIDEETGQDHFVAVLWHLVCLAWFVENRPEFDDRPKQ